MEKKSELVKCKVALGQVTLVSCTHNFLSAKYSRTSLYGHPLTVILTTRLYYEQFSLSLGKPSTSLIMRTTDTCSVPRYGCPMNRFSGGNYTDELRPVWVRIALHTFLFMHLHGTGLKTNSLWLLVFPWIWSTKWRLCETELEMFNLTILICPLLFLLCFLQMKGVLWL